MLKKEGDTMPKPFEAWFSDEGMEKEIAAFLHLDFPRQVDVLERLVTNYRRHEKKKEELRKRYQQKKKEELKKRKH